MVGARCAGATTAMLLARRGLRVLAIDRAPYGSDTLSTHALMRAGVLQLQRFGLAGALDAAGTPKIRLATFHYAGASVPVPIQPSGRVEALYAPRRTVLDALLVDAARAAGAEVRHGVSLVRLLRDERGRVTGATVRTAQGRVTDVRAGLVVGADGVRSAVARLVGAAAYRTGRHACALVYGHFDGLALDGNHFFYELGASAGAFPTNEGRAAVFVATPVPRFREEARADLGGYFDRALREAAPELAAALAESAGSGPLRGFPGQPGYLRQAHGPGWALVGDAGYFRDPLTAHGMTDALRDAELLARAPPAGRTPRSPRYQETRDEVSADFFEVTDAIASFAWDLDTVSRHHRALSRAMKAENALLEARRARSGRGGRCSVPDQIAS
ncbi:MAG: NAD(P)/FAD-dependent oxidoreductase [Sandaracinaceae bacterium]|nr:NAD(P)/FAD-dependent oxidoreductase [Sandaracinaceae bacterium]